MEKGKSRLKFAEREAAFDVYVMVMNAKLASDIARSKGLYLPVTGKRYLWSDRDCLD